MRRLPLIPLLALGVACADDTRPTTPPPPPPAPLTIQAEAGSDNQAGVGGTRLTRPLVVRVSRNGVPVAGEAVNWTTTSGSFSFGTTYTDATGQALVYWTLGIRSGTAIARAYLDGDPNNSVELKATVWPRVTVRTVGEPVRGQAGQPTSTPVLLRVWPELDPIEAGIPVDWTPLEGTVTKARSYTDENGIATTTWILGTTSGKQQMTATVRGHLGDPLRIPADVAPADPVSVSLWPIKTRPANLLHLREVVSATAVDEFGNSFLSRAKWEIVSGTAQIVTVAGISPEDATSVIIRPTGTEGDVTVRITLANGLSQDFVFTFTEPAYEVHLKDGVFYSPMNGSEPAVDTIPVGATLRWELTPFDYDEHSVESVGTPSFIGGEFPYGAQPKVTVTFTQPGTYQYRDRYSDAIGTVVVQ